MGQEHKEYTWNLIAKKLTGEASTEELLELEALLRSNPELYYPMQTMADLWKAASPDDQKIAERAFSRHLDRMQELNTDFIRADRKAEPGTAGHTSRRRSLLLASALCLLVIAGILFFTHPGPATPAAGYTPQASGTASEVFTRNGSRTNLVLPDSTQVWLNAGSRITYDKNYGVTTREVTLTGEAFFDVARNAGRPFVIHTARIDIKVLGTRFNVKSYPSDRTTEATLIRGSIEISIKDRPTEKIILKPNEKLVVANDDSTLHRNNFTRPGIAANESLVMIRKPTYEINTGAVIETSWVENKLIFQDEAFKDLARQMERWYGVSFRFTNPRQEEWRFTGNFQKETIQQALDALKLTEAFNYTIQENQITIYDR
jgi:transmembrane sensor